MIFFVEQIVVKKKYSINWENDEAVSFEVNGVEYKDLEDIPDEADQLKLEAMMSSTLDAEFDAEFEKMSKGTEQINGPAVEKVVLSVFTGISILMFLIAGIASFYNIKKISREVSAPGKVVDLVHQRESIDGVDRENIFIYPVIEYVSADGKRHWVQVDEGSYPPSYEIGEDITVLYDPEHPLLARIKSFSSTMLMWILPGITGILGIAFLGAVLAVRKWMPQADE